MADKKISELDAIAGSATAADDLFLIVDSSGSVTKKITRAELNNAIEQDVLSTVNITGGTIAGVNLNNATVASGDLEFADNQKAIFGAGSDLQIHHNANNSVIEDLGDGNLKIKSNGLGINFQKGDAELLATMATDGAVTLYHDNSAKIYTQAHGARIDGGLRFASSGAASDTANPYIFRASGVDSMVFATGSAERMRLNNSGQLLLNKTSVTASGSPVLETQGAASFIKNHTDTSSSGNVAFGAGNQALTLGNNQGGADNLTSKLGFSVTTTGSTSDGLIEFGSTAAGTGEFRFYTESGNTIANRMTLDSSGNLGIGTSPSTLLHLNSSSDPVIRLQRGGGAYSQIVSDSGGSLFLQADNGASGSSSRMQFNVDGAEKMRLDSSGNLQVGQTSNNAHLNSASGDGLTISSSGEILQGTTGESMILNRRGSDGTILRFRKDGSTVGQLNSISGPQIALVQGSTGLAFYNGGNQIYPTDGSGNRDATIDLGYASSRFKDGFFSNAVRANFFAGQADDNTYVGITGGDVITFATGGGERGRFSATGNLLLGQTSTDTPGTGNTTTGTSLRGLGDGFFSRSNGEALYLNRNNDGGMISIRRSNSQVGVISVTTSGTTYTTSSDRRLKSNIQDAASASDKIDAIQVRQFDWNADDSHQDYGLIAQELQPIEPLAVTGDADSDEMMGVDYSKLVPMLIKEIQELRGRVATLEAN